MQKDSEKGSTNLARLRFPHEKRKIRCAERYFAALGVNYQTIDPSVHGNWWEPVQTEEMGY